MKEQFGLKDTGPVVITGTWGDGVFGDAFNEPLPRRVTIQSDTVIAFGVEWYRWRTSFTATLGPWHIPRMTADGMVSPIVEITPSADEIVHMSEWWRRWGYLVLARPYDWWLDHTFRPWARWILRYELDSAE